MEKARTPPLATCHKVEDNKEGSTHEGDAVEDDEEGLYQGLTAGVVLHLGNLSFSQGLEGAQWILVELQGAR